MAKANQKQIIIIDTIISDLQNWKYSNDIDSPSHHTLIEESGVKLGMDDTVNFSKGEEVKYSNHLIDLLYLVKNAR